MAIDLTGKRQRVAERMVWWLERYGLYKGDFYETRVYESDQYSVPEWRRAVAMRSQMCLSGLMTAMCQLEGHHDPEMGSDGAGVLSNTMYEVLERNLPPSAMGGGSATVQFNDRAETTTDDAIRVVKGVFYDAVEVTV